MAQKPSTESSNGTTTEIVDETDATNGTRTTPTLQLRLEHPRDERRVVFHDGVIDNEHLNRKKSKCCCIYRKPLAFGESSSEDDEDCEHCFGHPEKRKRNAKHNHSHDHGDGSTPQSLLPDVPSTSTQAAEIAPPAEPVPTPSKPQAPNQGNDLEKAGNV
ncbi:E3 ubiquitin-protein ligase PPP1R11 [Drosophila bipectinata]|uniref:E3 ubiquitin-protein ligase PPP1R11 n=1 Tax=Drosophila bipectinata TaxID=42026 RepID=UPI001C893272|nr:E3 ubiquitin-protein ligase PPP1R11 [Drosophila bipectinata]